MTLAVRMPNPLGDAIMALPALERLARAVDGDVAVITRPGNTALYGGYRVLEARGRFETDAVRAAGARRLLLFTNTFSTALAGRLARVPERAGYAMHARSFLLTRAVACPRERLHQVDWYLHLARESGWATEGGDTPRLSADRARPSPRAYVVLSPGAGYGAAKRWTGFEALARALVGQGRDVVVLGARGEGLKAVLDPERCTDLAGRTTLSEALDWIAGAAAVVTNDSGLAHAAAALARPAVVVFGSTDARYTAPRSAGATVAVVARPARCAPCHLRVCPIDHRCMTGVTVADVLERLPA